MNCIAYLFALLLLARKEGMGFRKALLLLVNRLHAGIPVRIPPIALGEPFAALLHRFIELPLVRLIRRLFCRTLRFHAGLHLLQKPLSFPCLLGMPFRFLRLVFGFKKVGACCRRKHISHFKCERVASILVL